MVTTSYVSDAIDRFRYYKELGERAMQQVSDEALSVQLDPLSNSIAIIVKHLSGNMRSRWSNFLSTDGEKADRDRDAEFEIRGISRQELISLWEEGWKTTLGALGQLTDKDLMKTVTVRGQPESVTQAINRQITHCSYHIGQIVFLAKHFAGAKWKTLSVERGESKEFTARVRSGEISDR